MTIPSTQSPRSSGPNPAHQSSSFLSWLAVLGLIYLLIVGVGVISRGFRTVVGDEAEQLFAFAENPFLGLLIGILATALVQSSSTTTSIIVGLVAGGAYLLVGGVESRRERGLGKQRVQSIIDPS